MQQEGISPDKFTFFPVLHASASLHTSEETRFIHGQTIENYHKLDAGICTTSLVDMYKRCRSMEDAWSVQWDGLMCNCLLYIEQCWKQNMLIPNNFDTLVFKYPGV
jgi:hypothetical protein